MTSEDNKDPRYVFFEGLVREFNNRVAFKARCDLYSQLEELNVLGKVFTENARVLLRPYLFETDNCKHWCERELFYTHDNDELEECRVDRFLNEHMEKRYSVDPDEDYEIVRWDKAKQLWILLREMNYRILLIERAKSTQGTPLGLLPCSCMVLRRVRKTYPKVLVIEDLWSVNEEDLREKGVRTDTAEKIVATVRSVVQKKRRKVVSLSIARRLETAENAGQRAFF